MKKTISLSLLLLSLFFAQAYDNPVRSLGNAAFTATTNTICPGDTITFTATSTTQLGYLWKINGTIFSQNRIAGLRLTRDTTYTITLVAADFSGIDSTSQMIQVVTPPDFSFSNYVEETCAGSMDGELELMITAGTGPFSIQWSTGATTAGISQLSGGVYNVSVTDPVGCTVSDTVNLLTLSGVQTAINGNTAIRGRACKGDSVFFTNSSAIIDARSNFTWFQDGMQVSQMTDYGYTFADTGTYQLMLAGEVSGCRDTAYLTMRVTDPKASFRTSAGDQGCPGEVIQFTNTSEGATMYQWFNDTILISQMAMPSYVFPANGQQPIMLISSDGACADTAMRVVNVFAPTAAFTADTLGPLCEGEAVRFINASGGATRFTWLSNGATISQNANTTYTFFQAGTFKIDMIASDTVCTDTATVNIVVNDAPRVNEQVMDESCEGSADGEVNLRLQGSGPFATTWAHGPTTPVISGLSAGQYIVDILDANGCTAKDTFDIVVLGGITANYNSAVGAPGAYLFTDQSTPLASTWLWQFGDGNVSTMQNPTHTYTSSGNYEVCLIVTDEFGCKDTSCATLSVTVGIDKDKIRQLALYPNPTDGLVVLETGFASGEKQMIRVFDQMGREVMKQEVIAQEKITLNLSGLSQGVYTLLLEGKDEFWVGKVMKQ